MRLEIRDAMNDTFSLFIRPDNLLGFRLISSSFFPLSTLYLSMSQGIGAPSFGVLGFFLGHSGNKHFGASGLDRMETKEGLWEL